AQIDDGKQDRKILLDLLNRLAIHYDETSSPGLVPAENLVEALFECADIQSSRVMNRNRFVVERNFRGKLSVQPHLFLGVGQRNDFPALASRNLLTTGPDAQLAAKISLQQLPFRIGVFRSHLISSLGRKN